MFEHESPVREEQPGKDSETAQNLDGCGEIGGGDDGFCAFELVSLLVRAGEDRRVCSDADDTVPMGEIERAGAESGLLTRGCPRHHPSWRRSRGRVHRAG